MSASSNSVRDPEGGKRRIAERHEACLAFIEKVKVCVMEKSIAHVVIKDDSIGWYLNGRGFLHSFDNNFKLLGNSSSSNLNLSMVLEKNSLVYLYDKNQKKFQDAFHPSLALILEQYNLSLKEILNNFEDSKPEFLSIQKLCEVVSNWILKNKSNVSNAEIKNKFKKLLPVYFVFSSKKTIEKIKQYYRITSGEEMTAEIDMGICLGASLFHAAMRLIGRSFNEAIKVIQEWDGLEENLNKEIILDEKRRVVKDVFDEFIDNVIFYQKGYYSLFKVGYPDVFVNEQRMPFLQDNFFEKMFEILLASKEQVKKVEHFQRIYVYDERLLQNALEEQVKPKFREDEAEKNLIVILKGRATDSDFFHVCELSFLDGAWNLFNPNYSYVVVKKETLDIASEINRIFSGAVAIEIGTLSKEIDSRLWSENKSYYSENSDRKKIIREHITPGFDFLENPKALDDVSNFRFHEIMKEVITLISAPPREEDLIRAVKGMLEGYFSVEIKYLKAVFHFTGQDGLTVALEEMFTRIQSYKDFLNMGLEAEMTTYQVSGEPVSEIYYELIQKLSNIFLEKNNIQISLKRPSESTLFGKAKVRKNDVEDDVGDDVGCSDSMESLKLA